MCVYYSIWVFFCSFSFFTSIKMVSSIRKGESKVLSINWYRYVSNGIKGIRDGICHVIIQYVKANNKYMKIGIKIKNLCVLAIEMEIIYMDTKFH